jgi:hypothetical protein
MKTETFLKKVSVALSLAILVVGVSACAHHDVAEGQDYGQVRTEASATEATTNNVVVGTAPAPANAQNIEGTTTPAIISGPAKVDNSGRAYTSSAAGGAGNASATGLNTNVNIIPEKSSSNVVVTQSPAVTTDTTTQTTITETTTPAAPIVVETTTPVVTETTTTVETPTMASSTTQETTTQETTTSTTSEQTTTHRRMRKD